MSTRLTFKWRSRQVRQPVRTRLGLEASASLSPLLPFGALSLLSDLGPTLLTFLFGLELDGFGGSLRFCGIRGGEFMLVGAAVVGEIWSSSP